MKTCENGAVGERGIAISLRRGSSVGGPIVRAKGPLYHHAAPERRTSLQKVCSFTLEADCEAVSGRKGQDKICPYTLEKVDGLTLLHCRALA